MLGYSVLPSLLCSVLSEGLGTASGHAYGSIGDAKDSDSILSDLIVTGARYIFSFEDSMELFAFRTSLVAGASSRSSVAIA